MTLPVSTFSATAKIPFLGRLIGFRRGDEFESRAYVAVICFHGHKSKPSKPTNIIQINHSKCGYALLSGLPFDQFGYGVEIYRSKTECSGVAEFRKIDILPMGTKEWADRWSPHHCGAVLEYGEAQE